MAAQQPVLKARARRRNWRKLWGQLFVEASLLFLVVLWTIPTLGVFISSFRTPWDIQTSGWWTVLPHREWVVVEEFPKPETVDPDGVMEIAGAVGTFDEFRQGIETPDGRRVIWIGNKRLGKIQIQELRWTMRTDFTLDNYRAVLLGKTFEFKAPDGSTITVQGDNLIGAFLNSLTVAIPSTVIPILIAAFAAYGFAWMNFPGRRVLFIIVVALLVVPLQIALVPILQDYVKLNLNGTFLAVWLAHTGFGLPLATYLLFNYIRSLPRDILESAFIDGASHFTIFTRLVLPLSVPALASFAIFQFLWVWNDYLVALVFIGAKPDVQVLTMRIAEMVGSRGNDWHLLTAGAFVSMILPLIVFFSLQRYFVRGLLAGSVKG
ncbi:alpha-glucoside transport system permease protein [Ardenticatena maritima]|uniref:Alpha-glucoside transport system permease protein n=1 Tax=Ardenticatena maritima TaxID=872965 RepID=A0A0M8K7Y0_9CHLR|nr:carbohydrate ABC transporter permease [Ardenticatena maritima]GAP62582.1 alpha-glucoside transport system permease protein [Ardenticatena maritima]